MHYLLCKHQVEDYAKWRGVFDSHAQGQQESGLQLLHLLRDTADPNLVVMLFRVDDLDKAKAFIQTPSAREAGEISGVIGVPEVFFLSD